VWAQVKYQCHGSINKIKEGGKGPIEKRRGRIQLQPAKMGKKKKKTGKKNQGTPGGNVLRCIQLTRKGKGRKRKTLLEIRAVDQVKKLKKNPPWTEDAEGSV